MMGSGFELNMYVHRGAGAYICGEETGMLESLEGKRGQPRVKPPFPAVVGAFGAPTVINNVETLCNVPHIVTRGADWFKSIGTDERNTGPKLYAISGHVERPGTYEHPIGITFREMLETAGGMYRGGNLKAFIPGGASAPILTADQIDIKMDFDTVAKAGSMLGSAAVIVMDDTTCMVRSVARLAKFFNHESCGQCTPCREGTNWMELILKRLEHGEGREVDAALLLSICKNMAATRSAPWATPRSARSSRSSSASPRRSSSTCASAPAPSRTGGISRRPNARNVGRALGRVPKVTINDRTVEVEPGTNLVEAALKVGVQIPHYCYHPRLSVVGQCRMCLVEIEGRCRSSRPAARRWS